MCSIMKNTPAAMKFLLIFLLCIVNLKTGKAAFIFTLNVISHSTTGECDTFLDPACETYLSSFCLRGPRSTMSTATFDCPLGTAGRLDDSGIRMISSNQPWEVRVQKACETS